MQLKKKKIVKTISLSEVEAEKLKSLIEKNGFKNLKELLTFCMKYDHKFAVIQKQFYKDAELYKYLLQYRNDMLVLKELIDSDQPEINNEIYELTKKLNSIINSYDRIH